MSERMALARVLPIVGWIRSSDRVSLASDLAAAVVVTIMLVPQSLAYAMLAELPPEVGLYASIAPIAAYALFGSSRALAVGPVAVVSLMTAAAIADLGINDEAQRLEAALLLALMSGLFLGGLGLLRAGAIANYLSHPVISGFMAGSALLIAASQMRHILGVAAEARAFAPLTMEILTAVPETNPVTFAIGIVGIAALWLLRPAFRRGALAAGASAQVAELIARTSPVLVVIVATAVVAFGGLEERAGVAIVGSVPQGLPPVTLPAFDPGIALDLLAPAVLIALVGFVESVSVAHSLAARERETIDPDRELLGLGAANIAAGLSGGYPVTGGFARSVVNYAAGARTPIAGALTAIMIGLVAVTLTDLLYSMPKAILAATIIVAVLSLVDPTALIRLWRYDRADAISYVATGVGVLAGGVEVGILIGIGFSIGLYLWRTSRPHIAIVGRVPGTEHYRNVLRHHVITDPRVLALRVDESLYFANARYLEDRLIDYVAEDERIRDVVLIMSAVNLVDASAVESLERATSLIGEAGVRLHLAEVKGPVMDRLGKTDFIRHLTGKVYLSAHAAIEALTNEHASEVAPGGEAI